MSVRRARILAAVYFLLYLVAVTWPGYTLFNRVEPRILGLPFSLVWPTVWLVGAIPVLVFLDRMEARHRRDEGRAPESPDPGGPSSADGRG